MVLIVLYVAVSAAILGGLFWYGMRRVNVPTEHYATPTDAQRAKAAYRRYVK